MTYSIGLVELPPLALLDSDRKNWLAETSNDGALISKQILIANLRGEGFDVHLVDMRKGTYTYQYDTTVWRDITLSKGYIGKSLDDINPLQYDAWGVTCNFAQERKIAHLVIQHLVASGRPVVVGGSDVIAAPDSYIAAGASAAVLDKSGAANGPVMDYVLGEIPRRELAGVMLREGMQPPHRCKPLHPNDWHLPDVAVARQCLTHIYKRLVPF